MSQSFNGPGFQGLVLSGSRDLLDLHVARPERYPFLLESVARGRNGRFDILFAFPGERVEAGSDGFLGALDAAWQSTQGEPSDTHLPFYGGWFVYLGYELAQEIEPSLDLPRPPDVLPTAVATRIPAAIIVDHEVGNSYVVAECGREDLLQTLQDDFLSAPPAPDDELPSIALEEERAERYLEAVERIKRYITDGDVFQVNLSRLWRGAAAGLTPATLYRRLRRQNPAPFAGLAAFPEGAIVSSSPERLVQVRDGIAETRPIAGTLPRKNGDEGLLARELLGNPKERAEHVMLIDLERNDLGRVCQPGTIEVDELMTLESYAHVHHIVSNVRGRLRADVTPAEVIRAVFPGGTITGCPKVRCMEIVAELEAAGRGAYTGAMGYLNRDGSMDLNILIRTMTLSQGRLSLRAGAGIVADSQPERELVETRAKARGLLLALETAP